MNRFIPFSKKQLAVLNWWCNGSDVKNKNGIICDGAVRSGKTLCMGISFICWSFYAFCDTSFAICGKTISSLRRNVITPLLPTLKELGFSVDYRVSRNMITISRGNVTIPTIVRVVKKATTGTKLAPAYMSEPTSGNATKSGIKVILPASAATIVDIAAFVSPK